VARPVLGLRQFDQVMSVAPGYAVDTLLAPLGLLVASPAARHPLALLSSCPSCCSSPRSRASAATGSTTRSSCQRVSRNRNAPRRRHRGRRRIHRQPQPRRRRSCRLGRRPARARAARPDARGVHRAPSRRRQGEDPGRDHQQGRAARRRRVGDHEDAHGGRPGAARTPAASSARPA